MSDRFQLLSIKYIDGSISSEETDELVSLVKANKSYQKELAEMLVQDAAIQNVLGSQNQMEKELKQSGELKPFKSIEKHNSRRFQPAKKSSPWPMLAVAAILFLGLLIPMIVYKVGVVDENKNSSLVNNKGVSNIPQAEVVALVGDVYRTQNGKKEKLVLGNNISASDIIESDLGAFIKIQTAKKSSVLLNQNSILEWNEKNIRLKQGDLYAEIKKQDIPAVYSFESPDNSSIAVIGTAFEWSYNDRFNSSVLKVKEGVVEFYKGKEKKVINKNQMISSLTFEMGVLPIKKDQIAPWLSFIDLFANGKLFFYENFRGEKFKDFWWKVKSSKPNNTSSPRQGLICEGKDQITELIFSPIILKNETPLAFLFKASSIVAENSFEYGYEVWSDKELLVKQGYAITQIDEVSYQIKEVRNVGADQKLLNEVHHQKGAPTASGNRTTKDSLPTIAFAISLTPSKEKLAEKVSYKEGVLLSDISVGVNLKAVRVVFYLKTTNSLSKARWTFEKFAVSNNDDATLKALE